MSSLAFARAPSLFAEPPAAAPDPAYEKTEEEFAEAKARAEAFAMSLTSQGEVAQPALDEEEEAEEPPPQPPPSYAMTAFPGVLWADNWSCSFGFIRTICVSAWIIFLLFPALFFTLVRRGREHMKQKTRVATASGRLTARAPRAVRRPCPRSSRCCHST